MNKKLTLISFILEQDDETGASTISDMGQNELRRLSSMDSAKRQDEMNRRKRKEIKDTKSPRLRNLLMQKQKIEQQIEIERAKAKQGM